MEVSENGSEWTLATEIKDNYQRLVVWEPESKLETRYLRVVMGRGWVEDHPIGLFACEVGEPEATGSIQAAEWPKTRKAKNPDA